jgi:PEP-CTERM motif
MNQLTIKFAGTLAFVTIAVITSANRAQAVAYQDLPINDQPPSQSVPEPATMMGLAAVGGLAWRQRQRRQK